MASQRTTRWGMGSYYGALALKLPTIIWSEAGRLSRAGSLIVLLLFVVALLNKPIGQQLSDRWQGVSPWWSLIFLGFLVGYGLLRANFEAVHSSEVARECERNRAAEAAQAAKTAAEHRVRQLIAEHEHRERTERRERDEECGKFAARVRDLETQLDERAHRRRVQEDLAGYLVAGQALLRGAPLRDDDQFQQRVNAWTIQVHTYVGQVFGQAEQAVFLDNAGMLSNTFNAMRDGIHPNDDRCKNYVSWRMHRLGDLIKRSASVSFQTPD